jgi:hypothetical protein
MWTTTATTRRGFVTSGVIDTPFRTFGQSIPTTFIVGWTMIFA